jgi:archaemetzincin
VTSLRLIFENLVRCFIGDCRTLCHRWHVGIAILVSATTMFIASQSCQRSPENDSLSKSKSERCDVKLSDFEALIPLHQKLTAPAPDEWLFDHQESGQSLKTYVQSDPVCPDTSRNVIYIELLGSFDTVDLATIEKLQEYVEIFFGLPVRVGIPVSDSIVPPQSRRFHLQHEQLHTNYILHQFLRKNMPKDAMVSLAVTEKDIYPKKSWNFVFGRASLKERVGVASIYYFKQYMIDTVSWSSYEDRLLKTATHEISHMLSMKHCIDYRCLMNGSLSLDEMDSKPTWLCPECLAKLGWCTKSCLIERYAALSDFFHLNNSDKKAHFYKLAQQKMDRQVGN